mmetsp:Transcript_5912/g.13999  ORF Transcript_5912/g.13999 Transcript_5912/m.13999 type:complete len:100 (-) Transcript_5912:77-376(-)
MEVMRNESKGDIAAFFSTYVAKAQRLLKPVAARHGFAESEEGVVKLLQHLKAQSTKEGVRASFVEQYEAISKHFRMFTSGSKPGSSDGGEELKAGVSKK